MDALVGFHPHFSWECPFKIIGRPKSWLSECRIIRHPVSPVTDWKKLTMPELVRYRNKVSQSGIFLFRYRTETTDAGMPMPALVFWMPMPTYGIQQHRRANYGFQHCKRLSVRGCGFRIRTIFCPGPVPRLYKVITLNYFWSKFTCETFLLNWKVNKSFIYIQNTYPH
jgi:hypothetical protein